MGEGVTTRVLTDGKTFTSTSARPAYTVLVITILIGIFEELFSLVFKLGFKASQGKGTMAHYPPLASKRERKTKGKSEKKKIHGF